MTFLNPSVRNNPLEFKSFDPHQTGRGLSLYARLFASLVVLLLLLTHPSAAQTTYGAVVGDVTDATGASIPDANITLINTDTQARSITVSSSQGDYTFPNVAPGNYEVDFEKQGFAQFKRQGVVVTVKASVRVDAKMQIGDVNQTVSIDTTMPLLETEPGALGQLVEGRQVQEMPLNGRNVFNLLILSPGVVPQGSTGGNPLGNQAGGTFTNNTGFGNYQIGGGMSNQSAFFLDGSPLNTIYINSPGLVPTQDAIQEFRVDTNAVSAEFGHFAGGVVNMASRSGTNAIHGSAYEYIRNRVLNANTYFNKHNPANIIPTPAFTQNQYGVTFGGPIKHDKLFGFFSWEGFSFRKGNPILTTVPTAAFMSGDFSSLCSSFSAAGVCNPNSGTQLYDPLTTCGYGSNPACAPGATTSRQPFAFNKIPISRLDSASKQFSTYYGAPNQAPTIANPANGLPTNNFATNASLGGNTNQYNGRMDWTASGRQHVFGRYSWWSGTSIPNDPFHTHFGGLFSYTGAQNFVLGDTYTFSPHTVADFRLSYLRATNGFTPEQVGTNLGLFGPAWAALAPSVTLPVAPLATNGFYGFNGTDNRSITNDYALSGSLTRILGRHTLKFGGEARRNEWNFAQSSTAAGTFSFDQGFTAQINPSTNAQAANTGYAGASFFIGNPASGSLASIAFTDAIEWYIGAYFTDTFNVRKDLTITAGIRWEFPEAYTEHNDRLTVLLPNATDPLGAAVGMPSLTGQLAFVNSPAYPHRQDMTNRYKLFSPRVNIAYNADPSTTFRAGYGISWVPPDMVNYSLSPFQSPVNAATTTMVPSIGGTSSLYPSSTFANPFPTGLIPPIGHNPAQLTIFEGQSVISPNPFAPIGYAQQWNLEMQRQFTAGLMASIGYGGSKGTHLTYSVRTLNQLPDSQLALGNALNTQVTNPFYGHISSGLLSNPKVAEAQLLRPYPQFTGYSDTAGTQAASTWNALQTRVVKRFKNDSVLAASYTWSKLLSNTDTLTSWLESNHGAAGVQDWNNLHGEKSLASFDVPHRFVASYVYALPFGKNKALFGNVNTFVDALIGGWSVNGITTLQSGFPLAFTTATNQTSSQGGGSRPNVVSGVSKNRSGSAQSRITQWFNTTAFQAPPPFAFGNESRTDNTLRDHGVANWDFTVGKIIPFGERVKFDFRAEMFNVFNRVQFGDPGTSVGSATYGQVSTQANNPRLIQFAGRVSF